MDRDLNAGNVLYLQVNASYVLVLADHGNARLVMVPRGDTEVKGVAAIVERGKDDARSANLFFSPLSAGQAEWILKELRFSVSHLVEQVKREVEDCTSTESSAARIAAVMQQVDTALPDVLSAFSKSLQGNHRYLDDLESGFYIHVWQAAQAGCVDT